MIIQCKKCKMWFDDKFRWTYCPHNTFPANDGDNNYTIHHNAYLSQEPPKNAK